MWFASFHCKWECSSSVQLYLPEEFSVHYKVLLQIMFSEREWEDAQYVHECIYDCIYKG